MNDTQKSGLAKLREPFAPHQISKLPKPYKKDSPKGNCRECGGYHGLPAAHLDYVGHAALTDRLLDADPNWTWEPVAFRDGLPAFDESGGLWIKLTVCGVSRLGYGHAERKGNAEIGAREKEVIGDALRNAAMRFGAALDLWHKGELHAEEKEAEQEPEIKSLPTLQFNDFKARITAQITKEKSKAVWQEAVKACAAIGDKDAANKLKDVMLKHAVFIDSANKATA